MTPQAIRIPKENGIDLSGRSIEVVIGSDPPVSHNVHENLICANSEFFRTAMKQEWVKKGQRSVRLTEDDPDIFLLYLHWLYTRTLPIRIDLPGLVGNTEYIHLAKAYVLGDKLQDGVFQDVVVDMIVDKCLSITTDGSKWHPVGEAIQYIYENTMDTSKARRLLVDIYVSRGCGHWLHNYMSPHDIPKDFLVDLVTSLLDKRTNDPTVKTSLCEYHQHDSDPASCYRTSLM